MLTIITQIFAFVGFATLLKAVSKLIMKAREGEKDLFRVRLGTIALYGIGFLLFMGVINYLGWGNSIASEELARQNKAPQKLDERRIYSTYNDFVGNLMWNNYEWAYEDMSPAYRQKNSLEDFVQEFSQERFPLLSPVSKLEISSNPSTAQLSPDYDIYESVLDQSYTIFYLEKVEDNWYLTGDIGYVLD
ncbi:MAG: hypothetical protein JW987_11830 [Anaerolineaceae bacterium]|nr:hypothetical protein [Anaerolineaceae bacterium]